VVGDVAMSGPGMVAGTISDVVVEAVSGVVAEVVSDAVVGVVPVVVVERRSVVVVLGGESVFREVGGSVLGIVKSDTDVVVGMVSGVVIVGTMSGVVTLGGDI